MYLAKSEPRQEFTREDEETLVLFASQATSPPNHSVAYPKGRPGHCVPCPGSRPFGIR